MGTYSGTYPNGIVVTSAAQLPVTITQTGYVGDDGGSLAAVRVAPSIVGDISNFGVVRTTATVSGGQRANFHIGIWLQGGGSVFNGATGLIDVTGNGIALGGTAASTVTNLGTVEANNPLGHPGDLSVPLGVGVSFGTGTLTNGTSLAHSALIEGNGNGVNVSGGTVRNFAVIEAASNSNQPGYYGAGGSADGRGIAANYTSVSVIINYRGGAIEGHLTGIANGAAASVINSGSITAPQGNGITCTGGYIDNTKTGVVAALNIGVACYDSVNGASGGIIVNAGTIEATGTSGIGVRLDVAGATLTNSGTIGGAGGVAVKFSGLGGRGFSGYNHLIVGAGAVFAGSVIATGSDTIDLAKGVGIGSFTGLGSKYTGFGSVTVDAGAAWNVALEAAAFAGETITGNGSVRPLSIATAGIADLSGVSGFPVIALDPDGADIVALSDANFAGTAGGITVNGGGAGNTVDASAVAGTSHHVSFVGGAGADAFTGGAGADVFKFSVAALSGGDTVAGGGGGDRLSLTSSGTVAMTGVSGVETVALAGAGANTLVLTDANFAGTTNGIIAVIGGGAGNTVDGSALGAGHSLTFTGGAGSDKVTGGAGNDVFQFTLANLTAADRVLGGAGSDRLTLLSSGTLSLGGVGGVETIQLSGAGANTLVLTDPRFAGVTGGAIAVIGGRSGNTVNAGSLTGGNALDFTGGAGADNVAGGAGNDVFAFTVANLTAADNIAGGAGADRLTLLSSGTVTVAGVTGVENFVLAGLHANTLSITNANFAGVTGAAISIVGGDAGNTIDASAVGAGKRVTVAGGAGADKIFAGALATLTGGAGANQFVFSAAGGHTIADFAASAANMIVLRDSGFDLGPVNEGRGTASPKHLDITAFAANASGSFTTANQRFALNTTTGTLYYDADGNGTSFTKTAVALFQDHTSPEFHLAAGGAGNLFYVS